MHNELRYQTKTHTISEKATLKKIKILHLLPQIFFVVENNKIKKRQEHAYGKGNNI